ncbi:hypothetical protein Nit79A3_1844 [Nitrosomonas sp. Is79A3]|uniref:hypothetical protein n=1 Tax=Nitrosomonas sp. (strain Is79A3) TaxID=261292 RepID=UPI000215CB7D
MSKDLNLSTYNRQNRLDYLKMTEKIGAEWLKVFNTPPEDKTFWDTAYWDLFSKLWRTKAAVKKTDAISYMTGKTMPTATKYLNSAIKRGLITQKKSKKDPRSKLIGLSDDMRERLDTYFDFVLKETEILAETIKNDTKSNVHDA